MSFTATILPHRLQSLRKFLGIMLVQWCVHNTKSYGFEADTFFCILDCEAPNHRIQASFRDHRKRAVVSGSDHSDSYRVLMFKFRFKALNCWTPFTARDKESCITSKSFLRCVANHLRTGQLSPRLLTPST